MIGRCSCCKKIKWIFKNNCDYGYNQRACWECYCNSIKEAKKFHAQQRDEEKYYAGVCMKNWDLSYNEDDPKFIYKAFVAVCNFAEELSGCAGCPLKNFCIGSYDGSKFWNKVHRELSDIKL